MPVCTLLTDFGDRDYYVGAVKGTLLRLAPGATLVDISHQVAVGDVGEAAFLLEAAAPAFPLGTVHLAVVDPGVGSSRRVLAARADSSLYVAPDNGLLTPILQRAQVVAVEREDLFLPGPGHTFHGRDRFAPAAAALLCGEPLEALGKPIEDAIELPRRLPERSSGTLTGEVLHVDGRVELKADVAGEGQAAALEGPGDLCAACQPALAQEVRLAAGRKVDERCQPDAQAPGVAFRL